MSTFLQALWSTPDEPMTPLARYTQANGVFYMLLGMSFYAFPQGSGWMGAEAMAGQESGLLRVVGMCMAFIGWFYLMGARTNRDSFGLATVVDRVLLPLFLVPLMATGAVDVMLLLPITVLDPILGLGAYLVWRRQQA